MSKQVNVIVQDAMQKCSLVGDGQAVGGTQAVAALSDLNSVIAELNAQNLILQNVETIDVYAAKKIRFAVLPDNIHVVENWTGFNPDAYPIGDYILFKNEDRFYKVYQTISHDNGNAVELLDDTVNLQLHMLMPDVIVKVLPDRVEGCARLVGNRFLQLYPSNKMKMDEGTQQSLSTMYSCETENIDTIIDNENFNIEYFVIHLNSVIGSKYRITYLASFPEFDLYDTIYLSNKYIEVIEDGLCYKLCLRYKLLDVLPIFKEEYDSNKLLIKRINAKNRPMSYNFISLGDIRGSFYDNLAGVNC